MSNVHAVGRGTLSLPGMCTWIWAYSGARLRCEDTVIPGGDLCADHLIALMHDTPDPDVVPDVEYRAFGPVPVATPEVTL